MTFREALLIAKTTNTESEAKNKQHSEQKKKPTKVREDT